jgi:hypothetical protein
MGASSLASVNTEMRAGLDIHRDRQNYPHERRTALRRARDEGALRWLRNAVVVPRNQEPDADSRMRVSTTIELEAVLVVEPDVWVGYPGW